MSRKPIVIGISGPSGSGKSTLSAMLAQMLPNSVVVNADKYYKKELVKKYSRVRVFSVNDRVNHSKFGQGLVLDTMPDINKQRLLVKFDSGEIRVVQNRQVYKVVNGHVKKPVSKAR